MTVHSSLLLGGALVGAVCGVFGVILLLRGVRGLRDPSERRCPTCDYDLRGAAGRRCPECGHECRHERRFSPRHVGWRAIALAVPLLLLAAGLPWLGARIDRNGWRSLVPDGAWVVLVEWTDLSGPWHELAQWSTSMRQPLSSRVSSDQLDRLGTAAATHLEDPNLDLRRDAMVVLTHAAWAGVGPRDKDTVRKVVARLDDPVPMTARNAALYLAVAMRREPFADLLREAARSKPRRTRDTLLLESMPATWYLAPLPEEVLVELADPANDLDARLPALRLIGLSCGFGSPSSDAMAMLLAALDEPGLRHEVLSSIQLGQRSALEHGAAIEAAFDRCPNVTTWQREQMDIIRDRLAELRRLAARNP
ncbi:MAG: hypothetical protein KDA22_00035 [Phycisphaerales bacterium]|nr:hypothetical protein [Phycisphaerales bacterium]